MGKTTQETAYIDVSDVKRIEALESWTKSGFIREAVQEKLDRVEGEGDE
jgi:hypothetical protein